jgi:phosphoribosylaminoimidazolecarboxamide formyltransferase/IMP cyclohydrolase
MTLKLKPIKSALISVFNKEGIESLLKILVEEGVKIYSTGGTEDYIKKLGYDCTSVESITDFPSILDGRVKTLHPKVFGGILWRRDLENDAQTISSMKIPSIDMVIVDLYPFEKTVNSTKNETEIIEKIDIGGVSLIRAGAKNFNHVWTISSKNQYEKAIEIMTRNGAKSSLSDRKFFAAQAFNLSAHYDSLISNWLDPEIKPFGTINGKKKELRYGENPHQKGWFIGDLDSLFTQHSGKELSYNNLLDIDSAIS